MKAIQIDRYGGPEVMMLRGIDVPVPAADEVLIRLIHSGINVMDVGTRKGAFAASQVYRISLPTTLGMEGAGIVEQAGADVRDLKRGDRVAYCLTWGSYAEYAAVPAWQVVPVPDGLALETAAASTFQGFTAHYLATDVGRLGPGRTCLVQAAAGGVGQTLVALASRLGATVYGTVRTEGQMQGVRDRGADDVFLSADGAFVGPVLAATGGRGVDVVFDSIGRPTLRHGFQVACRKGLVVSFGASGGAVEDLNPAELGETGSLYLTRPRLKDYLQDAATIRRRAADIYQAMIEGGFSVPAGRRYGMERIQQAHEDLEARTAGGKAILDIA